MRAAQDTAVLLLLAATVTGCSAFGPRAHGGGWCATVQINPETQRCADGPTPEGGAYSIGTYMDAGLNPVPKDEATRLEIIEYDANHNAINSTVGTL